MKKLLSLVLSIVLFCALAVPASALSYKKDPLSDNEIIEITRAYAKLHYDVASNTDQHMQGKTFEEYFDEYGKSANWFNVMLYYGKCDNGAPVLFLGFTEIFGIINFQIGDYLLKDTGYAVKGCLSIYDDKPVAKAGGPVIFDDGKFISWEDAYKEGTLTKENLEQIWKMAPELVPNYGKKSNNPVEAFYVNENGTNEKYNPDSNNSFVFEEPENSEAEQSVPTTDEPDIPDKPEEASDTGDNTAETEASTSEEAPADTAEVEDESTPSAKVTRTVVKTMDKGVTTALIITGSAAVLIAAAVVVILIIRKKKLSGKLNKTIKKQT